MHKLLLIGSESPGTARCHCGLWAWVARGLARLNLLEQGDTTFKRFFIKKYSWLTHFGTANPNKYRIFVETANQSMEMMTQGLQMESSWHKSPYLLLPCEPYHARHHALLPLPLGNFFSKEQRYLLSNRVKEVTSRHLRNRMRCGTTHHRPSGWDVLQSRNQRSDDSSVRAFWKLPATNVFNI